MLGCRTDATPTAPQGDSAAAHLAKQSEDTSPAPGSFEFQIDEVRAGRLDAIVAGSTIDDRALDALVGLNSLRMLTVRSPAITDAGLRTVSKLSGLVSLSLHGVSITDKGLAPLAQLEHLAALELDCPALTDRSTADLARLTGLTTLRLASTQITPAGMQRLAPLEKLAVLALGDRQLALPNENQASNNPSPSGRGRVREDAKLPVDIQAIRLPRLRTITVARVADGTADLAYLPWGPDVQELWIEGPLELSSQGIEPLGRMSGLQSLILNCPALDDRATATLARLTHLERLEIDATSIRGRALKPLESLPKLVTLKLNLDQLDNEGQAALKRLPALHSLTVVAPAGTPDDRLDPWQQKLQKLLPQVDSVDVYTP